MRSRRFFLVDFEDGAPRWRRFDGSGLAPAQDPGGDPSQPVVAALPDRFLFFHQPGRLAIRGERRQRAAVELALAQEFPAPDPGQERAALALGSDLALGFITHPDFSAFREEHKAILEGAALITSPLALSLALAHFRKQQDWRLGPAEPPTALCSGGQLQVGLAAAQRAAAMRAAGADLPPALDWNQAAAALGSGLPWASARLSLRSVDAAALNLRPYYQAAAALALAALLFCVGELRPVLALGQAATAWEGAVAELYRKALGDKPGSDPYGRLLAKAERLKGRQAGGVDLIELLAALSGPAPEGLNLDTMALSAASGTVSGKSPSYEALETYLKGLGSEKSFKFTLEQATNAQGGVVFSIRVEPR
jgi:hypothetical protein